MVSPISSPGHCHIKVLIAILMYSLNPDIESPLRTPAKKISSKRAHKNNHYLSIIAEQQEL